jgi:hypothetical protein
VSLPVQNLGKKNRGQPLRMTPIAFLGARSEVNLAFPPGWSMAKILQNHQGMKKKAIVYIDY